MPDGDPVCKLHEGEKVDLDRGMGEVVYRCKVCGRVWQGVNDRAYEHELVGGRTKSRLAMPQPQIRR